MGMKFANFPYSDCEEIHYHKFADVHLFFSLLPMIKERGSKIVSITLRYGIPRQQSTYPISVIDRTENHFLTNMV